jgi:hypothetical protein
MIGAGIGQVLLNGNVIDNLLINVDVFAAGSHSLLQGGGNVCKTRGVVPC